MNTPKKLAALMGVILLSGMIFTGCSGNGQENSQISSTSVSSAAESLSSDTQSHSNSVPQAESGTQSATAAPNSSTSSQNMQILLIFVQTVSKPAVLWALFKLRPIPQLTMKKKQRNCIKYYTKIIYHININLKNKTKAVL